MFTIPERVPVTFVCNFCEHEITIRLKKESIPADVATWMTCPCCGKCEMYVKE